MPGPTKFECEILGNDKETDALIVCTYALENIDKTGQERILRYLLQKFGPRTPIVKGDSPGPKHFVYTGQSWPEWSDNHKGKLRDIK